MGPEGAPGDRPGPVGRVGGTVDGGGLATEEAGGESAAVASWADAALCGAALLGGRRSVDDHGLVGDDVGISLRGGRIRRAAVFLDPGEQRTQAGTARRDAVPPVG